jgi:hypothetical protein
MPGRYELVANTLSMLQLTRDGLLNIYQEKDMGPIWLYRKDLKLDEVPVDSEQNFGESDVASAALNGTLEGATVVDETANELTEDTGSEPSEIHAQNREEVETTENETTENETNDRSQEME